MTTIPMVKILKIDPYSNYEVTPKKQNITIQLLFKNYLLDSHGNLYTFSRPMVNIFKELHTEIMTSHKINKKLQYGLLSFLTRDHF